MTVDEKRSCTNAVQSVILPSAPHDNTEQPDVLPGQMTGKT
jgi:hypothetical protein